MQPSYTCWRCLRAQLSQASKRRTVQWTACRTITTAPKDAKRVPQPKPTNAFSKAASTFAKSSASRPADSELYGGPSSYLPPQQRVLLQQDNLFHSFTNSPSPEIRKRAAFLRHNAYCSNPSHLPTRAPTSPNDSEANKVSTSGQLPPAHVDFECPDCGIPVSCCEEHWAEDYEAHLQICDTLRQINEDDHDLRSGRFFTEFEYPGPQIEEAMVNMTNWDTLLYTREFQALNEDRHMRQATRLLTYPVTLGSVIHELSPYSIRKGGRLTVEGLKSLSGMLTSYKVIRSVHLIRSSSEIYPSSSARWSRPRYQGSAPEPAASPDLHSRSSSRVISAPGGVGSISLYVSSGNLPSDLHWS